jgi:hypothetical protein
MVMTGIRVPGSAQESLHDLHTHASECMPQTGAQDEDSRKAKGVPRPRADEAGQGVVPERRARVEVRRRAGVHVDDCE